MAGKLKVAAVGCGGIGHRHQLGYLQHPGAELVAVCDIDTAKAKTRAEELASRSGTLPSKRCLRMKSATS